MIRHYLLAFIIIALTTSCGSNRERKEYEEELDKIGNKTYAGISGNALGPALLIYNTGMEEKFAVKEDYARLLIGYSFLVSGKPGFTFKEANMVIEDNQDQSAVAMAHLLLSMGMYEKEWPGIAEEEAEKGIAVLGTQKGKEAENEQIIIHLIAGSAGVYTKNFALARLHFQKLGDLTGETWIFTLVDAAGDIQEGDIQKGLKKIKAASEDETIREEVRKVFKELITEIEKESGDIESPLFWPRLILKTGFSELGKSASPHLKQIIEFPVMMKDNLLF